MGRERATNSSCKRTYTVAYISTMVTHTLATVDEEVRRSFYEVLGSRMI